MTQLTNPPPPANAGEYLDDSFASWLTGLMEKWHVPGYSVAIVSKGEIHSAAYGVARLPDTPACPDTLYPMCSTSKAFTAALVGMCIEEAQQQQPASNNDKDSQDPSRGGSSSSSNSKPKGLEVLRAKGWKTPVREILPDFVTTDEYVTAHATLEDIASHRSGIQGHDYIWGPWMGASLVAATRTYRHLEAVGDAFRAKWQYNNLLYATLGHVAETVLGKPYEEALREKVLAPLGMDGTWLDITRAKVAQGPGSGEDWERRWARGYHWRTIKDDEDEKEANNKESTQPSSQEKGYYLPEQFHTIVGVEPAIALVSSVPDYAKWVRGLLDAARRSNEEVPSLSTPKKAGADTPSASDNSSAAAAPVISAKLFREVTTPRFAVSPPPLPPFPPISSPQTKPSEHALGWELQHRLLPGHTVVQHGGGIPGVSTLVSLLPDHDFGIVLGSNSDGGGIVGAAIAKELLGRRVGMPEEERRRHADDESKKKAEAEQSGEDVANEAKTAAAVADLEPPPAATSSSEPSAPAATATAAGKHDKVKLQGKFHNPAYGTFTFTPTSPSAGLDAPDRSLDGVAIVTQQQEPTPAPPPKPKPKPQEQPQDNKNKPPSPQPILMTPLGHRSLRYRFLLHPNVGTEQPYADKVIYGLEALNSHGDLSECAFPELDGGWGDPDDKVCPGPPKEMAEKGKAVWTSDGGVLRGGAVVELVVNGNEEEEGEGMVRSVGVRLGRGAESLEDKEGGDGRLASRWEGRMIWFTPVL